MGQGEVVGGEPALVDVGHHHVEAHFGEFHVGVGCHEWVVAEHGFALVVEGGCGGLVGGGVVACIVVAVEAELEVEGGYAGADVEAGAQGELGKGEDGVVGRCLVYHAVVPVEYAQAKALVERGGEHLD